MLYLFWPFSLHKIQKSRWAKRNGAHFDSSFHFWLKVRAKAVKHSERAIFTFLAIISLYNMKSSARWICYFVLIQTWGSSAILDHEADALLSLIFTIALSPSSYISCWIFILHEYHNNKNAAVHELLKLLSGWPLTPVVECHPFQDALIRHFKCTLGCIILWIVLSRYHHN